MRREQSSDTKDAADARVAAVFIAGSVYMWLEAAFRLLGTYTSLPTVYRLWQPRDGYITAMWLTTALVSLASYFVLSYGVFRGRKRVGSITMWTALLIVSAIAAPLIGEIGTPFGI